LKWCQVNGLVIGYAGAESCSIKASMFAQGSAACETNLLHAMGYKHPRHAGDFLKHFWQRRD
jgi:hypothetical protein